MQLSIRPLRHRPGNKTDERRVTKDLLQYWQLWALLLGFAVACVKFYYTVNDLSEEQKLVKASSQAHRDQFHNDLESIRTRLAVAEDDIAWLKKTR